MLIKKSLPNLKMKISELLKEGLTPHQLSLAIASGLMIGAFPLMIPGLTTVMCFVFALIFRVNMGMIQLANIASWPLQIALYIPFIRTGKMLFQISDMISWHQLMTNFRGNFWDTLQTIGQMCLAGAFVWSIFSVLVGYLVYRIGLLLIGMYRPSMAQ